MKNIIKLSNPQKLLLTIYSLSGGTKKGVPYISIVVESFKKYKKDFHLPGYPEYPDSELVNKELYRDSTKKNGLIKYSNKLFFLTDKGLDYANNLLSEINGKEIFGSEKIEKYIDLEIKRIKKMDALKHYMGGDYDNILDTDFYDYLGVSVRIKKNEFIGRLNILKDVVKTMQKYPNPEFDILLKFDNFMMDRFKKEIDYKINND